MTQKPKLKVDWMAVGKGIAVVLTGLGLIGGGSIVLGESNPPDTATDMKIDQHIATDSVRWVYTEKRLERMEVDISAMKDDVKEIRRLVIDLHSRSR